MQLNDLKKSVSEMTDEELNALIMQTRASRRAPKKSPSKKVTERRKEVASLNEMLENISGDALNDLLSKLGE